MNAPNSEIKTPITKAAVLSRDYVSFCGAPPIAIVPAKKMAELEQELQRLKQWKEENYDRNKNQWLTSVGMVCEDFPNVAARIKELREELQQSREEIANWKKASECEHEGTLEVHRQLSQWQECAREMNEALKFYADRMKWEEGIAACGGIAGAKEGEPFMAFNDGRTRLGRSPVRLFPSTPN